MNVATTGGLNFGWPCYEGFGQNTQLPGRPRPRTTAAARSAPRTNPARADGADDLDLAPRHRLAEHPARDHGQRGDRRRLLHRHQLSDASTAASTSSPTTARTGSRSRRSTPTTSCSQVLRLRHRRRRPGVTSRRDPVNGDIYYVSITTRRGAPHPLHRPHRQQPAAGRERHRHAGRPARRRSRSRFSSAGSIDPDGDRAHLRLELRRRRRSRAPPTRRTPTPARAATPAVLTVSDGRGGLARDTRHHHRHRRGRGLPDHRRCSTTSTAPTARSAARGSGDVSGLVDRDQRADPDRLRASSAVWNGAVVRPRPGGLRHASTQLTPAAPEHDLMLKVQGTSYTAGHIEVRYTAPLGQVQVSTYTPGSGWTQPRRADPGHLRRRRPVRRPRAPPAA